MDWGRRFSSTAPAPDPYHKSQPTTAAPKLSHYGNFAFRLWLLRLLHVMNLSFCLHASTDAEKMKMKRMKRTFSDIPAGKVGSVPLLYIRDV
jgi:hypothetical protein